MVVNLDEVPRNLQSLGLRTLEQSSPEQVDRIRIQDLVSGLSRPRVSSVKLWAFLGFSRTDPSDCLCHTSNTVVQEWGVLPGPSFLMPKEESVSHARVRM